nr:hypothetical protein [Tanacetum cinerariifolium]
MDTSKSSLSSKFSHKPSTSSMDNSKRMTYSEILDMIVYKLECEIRALFYSIPRNNLETGLTIVECDNDVNKMYDTAEFYGKLALMTIDESHSWEKELSASPLLKTPPLKKRRKGIAFQGKNLNTDFLHANCVDDHFDALDNWSYEDVYGSGCFDDDTSLNDEISSSGDLINYLIARDVEWQLPKNTQEEPPKPHYEPIKTEVEEPLRLDIVYPHSHVASSVMGTNRTERMFEWNETVANDQIQVSVVGLTYYREKSEPKELRELVKNRLQALVDRKKIIVNEASIRRDLRLDNVEVLDLEKAKTAQAGETASLNKRVKKLDRRNKSRTLGLKRLRKGRIIADIDAEEGIPLVDETQERNNQDMFDIGVLDDDEVVDEKEVSTLDPVTTAGEVVTTTDVEVSAATAAITLTISKDELTLAQTLIEIKAAKPKAVTTAATTTASKAKGIIIKEPEETTIRTTTTVSSQSLKDKGKEKMVESEKPLKKKNQIMIDEEIDADYELAQRLQAEEQRELTIEERSKMFVELINKRKKHFEMLRAEEKRRKPPTKAQKRKQMFKEVTEVSSKRSEEELEQEDAKRQRIKKENASAELKRCLEIVSDDEDDVTVEATPLCSKSLTIIDYKIYKEWRKSIFQIIRADGNSQMYLT